MDDDPVLRSLSADLERDDPVLAALLDGRRPARGRYRAVWVLLALLLLFPALILPARITLGLLAITLILASPVLACWLCAVSERPASDRS